ncbi:hypothetical protein ATCCBAA256_27320 [Mycobacterium montefiorense]|nr:hypothetical protein ATCCBAA256_27320 [Mycobacterium montefiorense]
MSASGSAAIGAVDAAYTRNGAPNAAYTGISCAGAGAPNAAYTGIGCAGSAGNGGAR